MAIRPKMRGFVSANAHPDGCAAVVDGLAGRIRAAAPGTGLGTALVVGASHGYGLASLLTAACGYGADCLGVALEHPPKPRRPGTAGWYNLAAARRAAGAAGRRVVGIDADAFAPATRTLVAERLRRDFGPVDLVVYSVAAPKREDPETGRTWKSVLKPIGAPYRGKSVDLDREEVVPVAVEPAGAEEITATVAVMGGGDWRAWIEHLDGADLLAPGCRSVAYSYIGSDLTRAIYRDGTIGRAKDDLERTAGEIDRRLRARGGGAWVSVNRALVTRAASALPVVPLYIGILDRQLRARGLQEDTADQVLRLFAEHLGPGREPTTDAAGRIRLDDRELDPTVQEAVRDAYERIDTASLQELADFAAYRRAVRNLYGFEVAGVDPDAETEVCEGWDWE